jgi:GNAT superfamily N-acetyltransferase/uncharacterized glyoxalase superfamily protein PhnB
MRIILDSLQPILAVPDVAAAVEFYKTALGFPDGWTWEDPPTHGGVNWDKAAFQFSLCAEMPRPEASGHWVSLRGVDEIYEMHRANGVEIVAPLESKPWGVREYTVRDLNGYTIRFAQGGADATKKRGGLPENFRLERRVPPLEDYERLIRAVKWTPYTNFETLPLSLQNAVAGVTAYDGEIVIGCALLTGDRASFFYVKDVMVEPKYQNRGVGSAVMTELMEIAHEIAPTKSLVGLYTGANMDNFYARFGFRGPEYLYGMSQRIRKPKSGRKK